jgi:hypothetical protein
MIDFGAQIAKPAPRPQHRHVSSCRARCAWLAYSAASRVRRKMIFSQPDENLIELHRKQRPTHRIDWLLAKIF